MYKVIWKVDRTVQTECPDYKPDPYTGEYPMTHCAVLHTKSVTEDKSADFNTKKEAQDFIKGYKPNVQGVNMFSGLAYDFKIVSHNGGSTK